MRLLKSYLENNVQRMMDNNVRIRYIGRTQELPPEVQDKMRWAEEITTRNTGTTLTLALNYSARSELVDAFRSMVNAASQNGGLEHLRIDEDTVSEHLYTCDLPDPDLVVRTSGEMRLSNFLLWQLAYAEIYVTPTLWPDFRRSDLLRVRVINLTESFRVYPTLLRIDSDLKISKLYPPPGQESDLTGKDQFIEAEFQVGTGRTPGPESLVILLVPGLPRRVDFWLYLLQLHAVRVLLTAIKCISTGALPRALS